jgi:hypothetical protein
MKSDMNIISSEATPNLYVLISNDRYSADIRARSVKEKEKGSKAVGNDNASDGRTCAVGTTLTQLPKCSNLSNEFLSMYLLLLTTSLNLFGKINGSFEDGNMQRTSWHELHLSSLVLTR